MWPKFGKSSLSMRPKKPINVIPPILNLVTPCFQIKSYCASFPNRFSQRTWIFSYSIQFHISSASQSNINHILHILQNVSFEEYCLLVWGFNLAHYFIFLKQTMNHYTVFRNWLSLIKHFTAVKFGIAKTTADLN